MNVLGCVLLTTILDEDRIDQADRLDVDSAREAIEVDDEESKPLDCWLGLERT